MFESVLRRGVEPPRRLGARAALSFGAHALALGGLLWLSTANGIAKSSDPEVTFFNPLGNGAPGKPALAQGNPEATPKPATTTQKARTKDSFSRNARAAATSTAPAAGDDDPYGSPNGDPNGSPFGDPNGTPGAGSPTGQPIVPTATASAPPPPPKNVVIPFGPGMDRPRKIGGPDPAYTREAREARVEGKLLVQCVITADGKLTGCSVLKSLPFMDQAVLSALAQQRWEPAKVDGKPVSVSFTIPFSFKLKD
jgi:protein TonB